MLIQEAVAFVGAPSKRLGGSEGVGTVVNGLAVLPATNLVLPVGAELRHCGTAATGISQPGTS